MTVVARHPLRPEAQWHRYDYYRWSLKRGGVTVGYFERDSELRWHAYCGCGHLLTSGTPTVCADAVRARDSLSGGFVQA